MTDPFQSLVEEHQHLQTVLETLDHLAVLARDGKFMEPADAAELISYLMDYAALSHHEKEETILTPALVAQGFDWSEEPLAGVRREHRQIRYLVRSLFYLTKQKDPWCREDARTFAYLAAEYVRYSICHMRRENGMFELAAARMSVQSKAELARRFDAFDAETRRSPEHIGATERADRVVAKYHSAAA